jgi:hypothetical protein
MLVLFEIERGTNQRVAPNPMEQVKADLVKIENASLINSSEIPEDQRIAAKGDRIAIVGNVGKTIGPDIEVTACEASSKD